MKTKLFYEILYKKKRQIKNNNICLILANVDILKLTKEVKESV